MKNQSSILYCSMIVALIGNNYLFAKHQVLFVHFIQLIFSLFLVVMLIHTLANVQTNPLPKPYVIPFILLNAIGVVNFENIVTKSFKVYFPMFHDENNLLIKVVLILLLLVVFLFFVRKNKKNIQRA